MSIYIPKLGRGRPSAEDSAALRAAEDRICELVHEIAPTLDFGVGARGWCYLLEPHGVDKDAFDWVQRFMVDARKDGRIPVDVVAEEDGNRFTNGGGECGDPDSPEECAENIVGEALSAMETAREAHLQYEPVAFWERQPCYIQVMVEKADLRSLFEPVCYRWNVRIANASGDSNISTRVAAIRRFQRWEEAGNQPVLLYCGDHDPAGLRISGSLRKLFEDLELATGWSPGNLVVDRFGLNFEFIEENGLTWVENLKTQGGKHPLDDPRHKHHQWGYVQDYLAEYGARKCEANALVVRPEAGRQLCEDAILKYVDLVAEDDRRAENNQLQEQVREEVERLLENAS